jgi:outer membrane protein, multidrug efflux system
MGRPGWRTFLILAGLSGCTVGPSYHTPTVPLPTTWSALPESSVQNEAIDLTQWWTTLDDPVLNSLIERAVQTNLDLRLATARIREARALRGVTAADLWPTINSGGSYLRFRGSENTFSSSTTGGATNSNTDSFSSEGDLFQVNFDATWELDLFGRVQRSLEAAEADIAAEEENLRDVLVTLVAEVARNYVELRGFQRQLFVTHNNIQSQQQSVELTNARFQAGLTSGLDVAQAEAQLSTTQSQTPTLESAKRQSIHRLGVLLGQLPETLINELTPEKPIPSVPPEILVGLPSELLQRRPDVRRAERQASAETARIGVATADLFPRFVFSANVLGLQSVDITDLALASSRFWSVGPTIRWPIFDAGRIRANIEAHSARGEQSLARYEQTVLTAIEEVENTLVAYTQEHLRQRALASAVEANRRSVALAYEQYTRGLGDFLNVLDAQRSLYNAEDQLVQSERAITANLIALYKALGGGWEITSQAP